MAKKTTLKTASLGYRAVGGNGEYTAVMGVLKGLTLSQDDPESTEIEAEFYDAPFDITYDGNPPVMSFSLVNYDLSELPNLFGGTYDATTDTYDMPSNAFTTEYEWRLEFQKGNKYYVMTRGLTIGTIGKEEDGAFAFNVTVTGLTDASGKTHKIVGGTSVEFTEVDSSGAGYNSKNPKTEGWFESDGTNYRLTWDTEVVADKTYYTKS